MEDISPNPFIGLVSLKVSQNTPKLLKKKKSYLRNKV